MEFHEKSAWISLLGVTGVFIPYFLVVIWDPVAFIGLLPIAAIVLTAFLAGYHIINAIATTSIRKRGDVPPQDELEKLIELRAAKFSGFVLAFLVISWYLIVAFGLLPILASSNVSSLNEAEHSAALLQLSFPAFQVFTALNVLFAGFVVSNIVYYSIIIAGYRKLTLWTK